MADHVKPSGNRPKSVRRHQTVLFPFVSTIIITNAVNCFVRGALIGRWRWTLRPWARLRPVLAMPAWGGGCYRPVWQRRQSRVVHRSAVAAAADDDEDAMTVEDKAECSECSGSDQEPAPPRRPTLSFSVESLLSRGPPAPRSRRSTSPPQSRQPPPSSPDLYRPHDLCADSPDSQPPAQLSPRSPALCQPPTLSPSAEVQPLQLSPAERRSPFGPISPTERGPPYSAGALRADLMSPYRIHPAIAHQRFWPTGLPLGLQSPKPKSGEFYRLAQLSASTHL